MRAVFLALLSSAFSVFAAHGPAESAVDFVKKLGTGKVDFAPEKDTAMVSEISPKKMESILQRLHRMASELNGEQIKVGPTRIEGTLAGVILHTVDPADPMAVRVLPLALVRNGEIWRVAPVPASFENTVAAYSRSSRTIAQKLELWLAQEQINEVERIKSLAGNLLRDSLAKALAPETIRAWSEEHAVAEFLSACENRDIPRILALSGGLSDTLPDGWQHHSAAIRKAITSAGKGSDSWSLMTSPSVLRYLYVRKQLPNTRATTYRLLCADPRNSEIPSLYELGIVIESSDNGLWKINPESQPDVVEDDEIQKKMAALITGKHPLRAQSTAEELKRMLIASFQAPDARYACLGLMDRENNPAADLNRYMQAIVTRWETMNPTKPVIPIELGFQQESDHAYLALEWLSLGRLAYEPRIFHFKKMPDGWIWNISPDKIESAAAENWVKKNETTWRETCLPLAVRSCALPDFSLPSPDESAASALAHEYLEALSAANWHKALSLCAQLGIEKSPTLLLRNLGYEGKCVQLASKPLPHDVLTRGKHVTLVVARSGGESSSISSLLPVVSTPSGPRVLMEIDLGDPSQPGRSFLNRNALGRLASADPKVAEELKDMISKQFGEEAKNE